MDEMNKQAVLHNLIECYDQDIRNYAFALTHRADLADDIAQDVFLKAYQHLESFRGEAAIKSWLFSITRNVAYNYKTSAFFRRVILFDVITRQVTHPSAEQEALNQVELDTAWQAVMKIPTKLREVLVLYAHHQFSYTEIAEILRISEGTVKSRLNRARSKVSDLLEEEESEWIRTKMLGKTSSQQGR